MMNKNKKNNQNNNFHSSKLKYVLGVMFINNKFKIYFRRF